MLFRFLLEFFLYVVSASFIDFFFFVCVPLLSFGYIIANEIGAEGARALADALKSNSSVQSIALSS